MRHIDEELQKMLAKHMMSIPNSEKQAEEWVLTKDEEELRLANAIREQKELFLNRHGKVANLEVLNFPDEFWLKKIDVQGILKQANSNKLGVLWHEKNRIEYLESLESERELKEEMERLEPTLYTYEWFMNYLDEQFKVYPEERKGNRKQLVKNSQTLPLIQNLCYFLTEDKRFENNGFSLKKGLLIRGVSGLGKSMIPSLLKDNPLKPIHIISMSALSKKLMKDPFYEIDMGKAKILYIDDVGSENPDMRNFGNFTYHFKEFLESYYEENKKFNRLIISTNISPDEFENRYSHKIRDRIKEMFNVLTLDGQSLRT